jgi:hypothetical protein
MRPRSTFALGRAVLAASVLLAAAGAAAGPKRVSMLSKFDQGAVERARAGAARKLQEPECQRVLEDFRDGEGRPLRQSLEKWRVSAAEYVQMIPFLDGSSHRLCLWSRVELVSSPGTPRVYVCGRLATTQVREPGLAEAMVIHEMLHTLGLGENPPTSVEITQRVKGRCG